MAVRVTMIDGTEETFEGDIEVCVHKDGWVELWDENDDCLFIIPECNVFCIKEVGELVEVVDA